VANGSFEHERTFAYQFSCSGVRTGVYPPGLTAEMLAADPDLLRARPVHGASFWDDLEKALDANPKVGPNDAAMADQARTLLELRRSDPRWKALLDRAALTADTGLYEGARYDQVGVDAGNGWQRQENRGAWGSDWYGRACRSDLHLRQRLSRGSLSVLSSVDGPCAARGKLS
jgi:hypothetical protein